MDAQKPQQQDFDSILNSLPKPAVGPLQKAKCVEFVKKLTHNGTKSDQEKILATFNGWLKFMRDKLSEESKALFKDALTRLLGMMQRDGKIVPEVFVSEFEAKLKDEASAAQLRKDWLSCWSDMFTACDSNRDNRLVLDEAQTLLLAFNVPLEFSEPLFELLCDEFEETLDRRSYIASMNDYFFTEDRDSVFGQLFGSSVGDQ
ncbi:hypothetical protein BOX15_Mlig005721g3 [Macrostomum lignano]|uniref:EF-hand domain-containing protein n=1 Tax=Macrostomum lignano TaxID=282301 RepID=A0A267GL12_9PLAT|nr:hypothetical protein BOX15_Mlig005721g1 [Macrostomum lignano]PAA86094.1 hypothetical protein BOX15_Mlig005721g3 [Macrostomum lignano]